MSFAAATAIVALSAVVIAFGVAQAVALVSTHVSELLLQVL